MGWQEERMRLFPLEILLAAQRSERATGVPACVTLAQWALESAYGRRVIGRANPFGIKWPRNKIAAANLRLTGARPITKTTHEEIKGKLVKLEDNFIDFPDLTAAFKYHGQMLVNPKGYYAKHLPLLKVSWQAWLKGMATTYATDSKYADKLLAIIDKYHLYDYNLPKA